MPDRRAAFSAAGGPTGALVLHGFTGTPASMRPLADAIALAGYAVELPLLPGHATTPADLGRFTYGDFVTCGRARATKRCLARTTAVVAIGLSMGSRTLRARALRRDTPSWVGVVLINPLAEPAAPSFLGLLRAALAGGSSSFPSIGSDIAQPGEYEGGYDETPIAPLLSVMEAIAELGDRLGQITSPVLLFSSRVDADVVHAVDRRFSRGDAHRSSSSGSCSNVATMWRPSTMTPTRSPERP